MPAHHGPDGVRSLVSVIEGDLGDVVVENVSLDDAVEKSASDETKLAVDGGGSSTSVCPGVGIVMRQGGIGVLQEGDGDEPVVDPQVRDDVPDEQVREAECLANPGESCEGDGDTKVAEQDEVLVFALIQRAGGDEVVDAATKAVLLALALAFGLALVVVVASNVADDVQRPSSKLLPDAVKKRSNGRLLGQLIDLVDQLSDTRSIHLSCLGHKNHIALNVASGLVVFAVRDFP